MERQLGQEVNYCCELLLTRLSVHGDDREADEFRLWTTKPFLKTHVRVLVVILFDSVDITYLESATSHRWVE